MRALNVHAQRAFGSAAEGTSTRLFRRGRSWHNELLVPKALTNSLEHNRYGFDAKAPGWRRRPQPPATPLREAIRVLPTIAAGMSSYPPKRRRQCQLPRN